MSTKVVLSIGGGVIIGVGVMVGIAYYQGGKDCRASYQLKLLKAQAKNREIALAYYKSAKVAAEQIAGEANESMLKEKANYDDIKKKLDDIPVAPGDEHICVDVDFLRSLRGG